MEFWMHTTDQDSKTGYFGKLKQGLVKSSMFIRSGFMGLFSPERKKNFEEDMENLERTLIEADLGADFSMHLISELRRQAGYQNVEKIREMLKAMMLGGFLTVSRELKPSGRPGVILFAGVNGSGKTTSIAKIGGMLQNRGKKILLAAGDTFRAAAVEQISLWAEKLGAPVVRHKMGADPGAVAHDACEAAKARDMDYVLMDTAGRIHNQNALMEELKKVVRVIRARTGEGALENILVLDGNAGQNSFMQARFFREAVGVDGIIITKLDGTARGGIVVRVEKELGIPVKFIGVGEKMDDLLPFSPEEFVEALLCP